MIENKESVDPEDGMEVSAFVESMCTGVEIPADLNYKDEYGNYLSEKYK